MLPHCGQGLNNTILDCQNLIKEVDAAMRPDLNGRTQMEAFKKSIVRYEETMCKRGLWH